MPHGPVELRGIEGLTPERMRLIQRYLSRPGDYMYAPSLPIDATPFPESIPKEKVYGTADPIFGPTPSRDIVGDPQQAIRNAYIESSEPGQPGLYDRALGLGRIAGDALITRGGFGTPYESSRRLLRSTNIPDLSRSQINQLAVRAQAGDEAAKAQLFDQLQPIFVNLAQKYKAPATELEDFVMMANEEVLRHLPKYNAERGDFVTLAQRFGQRAMSNYAQRSTTQSRRATTTKGVKGRLDPLEADKPIGQSAEGEDLLLSDTLEDVAQRRGEFTEADMEKMYDRAMKSMTEKQRQVWELRQQDLAEEQIATQMGITRQAVNKHLEAAYRRIFDVTREMGFPAPSPPRPKGGYKAVRRPGLSDLRPEGTPEGGPSGGPIGGGSQGYSMGEFDQDAASYRRFVMQGDPRPGREPDPEIIRQIQGVNQNLSDTAIPGSFYPTAEFDNRITRSLDADEDVARALERAGYTQSREASVPGMPQLVTEIGTVDKPKMNTAPRSIMSIKEEAWGSPSQIEYTDELAEISGGSGHTPEDQAYIRDWNRAYENYNTRRASGKDMNEAIYDDMMFNSTDEGRSVLGVPAADEINLPPPLRSPLSPDQAATVDQLGVGRLRAPLKEPDPEIIRQIQGVNQNTEQIEFPELGWHPTADFDDRVRLSQLAGERVADDLFQAGHRQELEWGDQIPGMPLYHSNREGGLSGMPGRGIMDIKTEYYDPTWLQREDALAKNVQTQEDMLSRNGINLDDISPEEAASLGWTRDADGIWRFFEGLRSFHETGTQPRWPEGSAFESVNQLRPRNVRFGLGNLPSGDSYGP